MFMVKQKETPKTKNDGVLLPLVNCLFRAISNAGPHPLYYYYYYLLNTNI